VTLTISRALKPVAREVGSNRFEAIGLAASTCVAGFVQAILATRYVGLAGSEPGDIQQYGLLAKEYAAAGATWTYSLWYALVDLSVVKPSSDANWIAASLVLQGSLYFLKGAVLVLVVSLLGFRWPIALLVSLLVGTAAAFPWPDQGLYSGTFPGSTFTSITQSLSTIAITLAVGFLVVYLRRPSIGRAALLGAACMFVALSKPSWVPGLVLAIGTVAVWRHFRSDRNISQLTSVGLLVVTPALFVVAASYLATLGSGGILSERDLIWEPFRSWNLWSDTPLVDLIRSLAFPLAALPVLAIVGWRAKSDKLSIPRSGFASAELEALSVGWIAFLASLGLYLGWTEFIPGWGYPNDFNLAWGVQSSVFALNLLTAVALLGVPRPSRLTIFPAIILLVQTAAAVDWMFRVFPAKYGLPG
jgi:hypothetical protein